LDKAMDLTKVEEIIAKHHAQPNSLIEVLLDLQEEYRYLPEEALRTISANLKLPLSQVYYTSTFYNAFSLEPKGKYCISVCLGTACQVGGGVKILEKFERDLGITRGGTTEDMNFSLDEVHCLGCCGLAPVATVNDDVHGKLTLSKVTTVLKKYSKKPVEVEDAET
jgi:NADH:ubiquinone oxidoreductase subunit E